MAIVSTSTLNYFEGMSEAYAETVARTNKPLSSFEISFDDNSENIKIIDKFSEEIQEKADIYGVKCFLNKGKSYYKDLKGRIFTKPYIEFIFYKEDKILKEYLNIYKKEKLSLEDHKRIGQIFGYTEKSIRKFLKND